MPATEKNANTFDMTSLSAVNSGYSLMLINNSTNEGQLITMTDLATMILNEIRNQTFTATELGQSSASTLPAAISSLNSATIRFKAFSNPIPAESDLNDYIEPGTYACGVSATAKTLLNCPVTSGFRMDVFHMFPMSVSGNVYGFQILNCISSSTFFRRRFRKENSTGECFFQNWVSFSANDVE